MKIWLLIVTALFCSIFCDSVIWSQENFVIRNPIGPSTVPPSSISSGLVRSPDPIETTGNLLITGNVRRGRHFRGSIPYQSTSNFNANLGSSSLSSFLRDSAGSEDYRSYSNEYQTQPYYSPSQTVTTTMPGRAGVFIPNVPIVKTAGQQQSRLGGTDVYDFEFLPIEQSLNSRGLNTTDIGMHEYKTQSSLAEPDFQGLRSRTTSTRTLTKDSSQSLMSAERLVPGEIGISWQDDMSTFGQSQKQVQDIREDMRDRTPALDLEYGSSDQGPKQDLLIGKDAFGYQGGKASLENLKSKFEIRTPSESTVRGNNSIRTDGFTDLDEYMPGVKTRSQISPMSQNGAGQTGLSNGSRTFQEKSVIGVQDSLIKHQGVTAIPDTGYTLSPRDVVASQEAPGEGKNNVIEQIRQQIDDLTRSIEMGLQERSYEIGEAGKISLVSQSKNKLLQRQQYTFNSRDATQKAQIDYYKQLIPNQSGDFRLGGQEFAPVTTYDEPGPGINERRIYSEYPKAQRRESPQKESSVLDELGKVSQADISAEAKEIMGPYKNLRSFSSAKFNQHMRTANDYFKAGRYYKAANTFALASLYDPDNPLAFAGRGHALFAAGEYISSALFISRALVIDPECALVKIDLATMLGGENELASRIADVEQGLARSSSNELQFLLSYVYYRTAKLQQAKQTIDAVYEKMPEAKAVQAIKRVIENAVTSHE